MAKYRTDTGLELDEDDPDDRKILERQRAAARDAGRGGGDRTGSTRGRPDLEAAYDEGAAEPADSGTPQTPTAAARSGGRSARSGTAPKGARKGRKTGGKGGGRGGVSVPPPRLIPPRSVNARDWGGFAFGLILHALVVSYIRYGKEGPKGWLRAKFLNRPIQGEDLERENRGGGRHENPDSVPWEDLTPEERENII